MVFFSLHPSRVGECNRIEYEDIDEGNTKIVCNGPLVVEQESNGHEKSEERKAKANTECERYILFEHSPDDYHFDEGVGKEKNANDHQLLCKSGGIDVEQSMLDPQRYGSCNQENQC